VQIIKMLVIYIVIFLLAAGCVSTLKNTSSIVPKTEDKFKKEICISLKLYNEKKPINKGDYVKTLFYESKERMYKNALNHWNISTNCESPQKEYEITYHYDINATPVDYIWFTVSMLTLRLVPYWSDYAVSIQLKDLSTSRLVVDEKMEFHTKISAFQLSQSISQMLELRERTGTDEAPDAFLIERTASLIMQNH